LIKKSSNREGAAENKKVKSEILFINLIKSEENFFQQRCMMIMQSVKHYHWQSHNAYGPETGKGLSYINHAELNKKIFC
jgi:hypothetical protein